MMSNTKSGTPAWLLLAAMITSVVFWLCRPSRRQPEWVGKLLLRLGPQHFRWHVRCVVAANKERGGQMKAHDYLRVLAIGDRTRHMISDKDLAELLHILNKPSLYPQIVHGHIAARLLDVPYFSESQKERIFHAFCPLLSLENPGDTFFLHQQQGIKIMKHLGDRRSIAYLLPLLQHPREKIKVRTQEALATMGYSVTQTRP